MTVIRDDLRGVIKRTRKNPVLWGNPHGLTQRELANMTKISQIYIRQIEKGLTDSASPNALGVICYKLRIEPKWLRDHKYRDVAEVVTIYLEDENRKHTA